MFGDVAIVNRRMNNPHIQKKNMKKLEVKIILQCLKKESAAKGMIKAFKENKTVCVVIDQYLNSGIDIEF